MAVQKSKKSRARGKMRRRHYRMSVATTSEDSGSGETHLRHHVSANGYYRGKQVLLNSGADNDTDDD